MERNHCGHLGHSLAHFDPEVILLLQSKFRRKATKVWEEMSKIDFEDGGCGGQLGFSISSFSYFSYFVSTRRPNAHHQVSIKLGYRGDVQNMNSQHFFNINV